MEKGGKMVHKQRSEHDHAINDDIKQPGGAKERIEEEEWKEKCVTEW